MSEKVSRVRCKEGISELENKKIIQPVIQSRIHVVEKRQALDSRRP